MVLTQDDRATFATCFNEKGWRGARLTPPARHQCR